MLQFILDGISKGSVYALVATGFGLIYTTTGVFHLAHGAIYILAAYTFFVVSSAAGVATGAVAAVALAGCAGPAVDRLAYEPLARRGASSAVILVTSLGLYTVLVNVVSAMMGNEAKTATPLAVDVIRVGPAVVTPVQASQVGAAVLALLLFWCFLSFSSLGRICRAVADDPKLAAALGINVASVRLLVFALGSAFGATGAVLMALDVGMDPWAGFPIVMISAAACIIGGLNHFAAPALGAIVIAQLEAVAVSRVSAQWESAVTFVLLITFLLWRPTGILGIRRRLEER